MITQTFTAYFAASAGAGAALIGLLFVAISIAPERTVMPEAPIQRQSTATGAFTALVNAFFVSLSALIPGDSLGWVTAALAAFSLLNTLSLGVHVLRRVRGPMEYVRHMFPVVVSLLVYGFELSYGIQLVHNPADRSAPYAIAGLLLGVYGFSLLRAWQLLGARRYGFLGWLSSLNQEVDADTKPVPPVPATRELG
jgi:hypothetical protein